jgi:hypothetical protein
MLVFLVGDYYFIEITGAYGFGKQGVVNPREFYCTLCF